MIYESRPNVTIDAAALAIKSGNAMILRGGKEALCTNKALVQVIQEALANQQLDTHCIQLIEMNKAAKLAEGTSEVIVQVVDTTVSMITSLFISVIE